MTKEKPIETNFLDPNLRKRSEMLFNSKKFLKWLDSHWEKVPEIEIFTKPQFVFNRKGRIGWIVANWDKNNVGIVFTDDNDPPDDIGLKTNYRNAFVVRELWADFVTTKYPRP